MKQENSSKTDFVDFSNSIKRNDLVPIQQQIGFLEYYIMEVNKCPKAVPPSYELLYKQIEQYTVKVDVEHISTKSDISFLPDLANCLVDIGEDYLLSEEAAGRFLNEISANYHHSAGNASKIAESMFISAYNITNNDQFILASKSIATILGTDIKTIKEIVQKSKCGIIDRTLFFTSSYRWDG